MTTSAYNPWQQFAAEYDYNPNYSGGGSMSKSMMPMSGSDFQFGANNMSPSVNQFNAQQVIPQQQAAPGMFAGMKNWLGQEGNLGAAVGGINALTSAWMGYKNYQNAKNSLNFQKEAFRKNFANQTQSYNTSLEDRIRGRSSDYNGKEADVQSYLSRHRLKP